jgi:hypothetical protein
MTAAKFEPCVGPRLVQYNYGGEVSWVVWCGYLPHIVTSSLVDYHCTIVLIKYTNKEFRSMEGSELIEADRPRLPKSPDCVAS